VIADDVAFCRDVSGHLGTLSNVAAKEEEDRLRFVSPQDVEDGGRAHRMRPVIKRQEDPARRSAPSINHALVSGSSRVRSSRELTWSRVRSGG